MTDGAGKHIIVLMSSNSSISVRDITKTTSDMRITYLIPGTDPNLRVLLAVGSINSAAQEVAIESKSIYEIVNQLHADAVCTFSDELLEVCDLIQIQCFGLKLRTRRWHKSTQRSLLAARGLRSVQSIRVLTFEQGMDAFGQITGPCIIKPDRGVGSRETWCATTTVEAEAIIKTLPHDQSGNLHEPMVVESYIPSRPKSSVLYEPDYLSVDVVVAGGHMVGAFLAGRLPLASPFRETGIVGPLTLNGDLEREVCTLAWDACEALEVDNGCFHVEIKIAPQGPIVIEVNGRLGGHVNKLYELGTGQSLIQLILLATAGQIGDSARSWESAVCGIVYPTPSNAVRLISLPTTASIMEIDGVKAIGYMAQVGQTIRRSEGSSSRALEVWITATASNQLLRRVMRACTLLNECIVFIDDQGRPASNSTWLQHLSSATDIISSPR